MYMETLREKREQILQIARKHGVGKIFVFGSVSRGEAKAESDIDFLIEVNGPTSPWFPGGLVVDLEALLGRRVDVVEQEALKKEFAQEILKDAVAI
jgi:predicted nucleotidyltransferase